MAVAAEKNLSKINCAFFPYFMHQITFIAACLQKTYFHDKNVEQLSGYPFIIEDLQFAYLQ